MWISTKGRNAVKVMMDLGQYATGEPVKVKDIARRQDISDKYLEQIISMLNKAGMILEAVEGDMSVIDDQGDRSSDNITDTVCMRLWDKLDESVHAVLDKVTLADMLEWQETLLVDQYMI